MLRILAEPGISNTKSIGISLTAPGREILLNQDFESIFHVDTYFILKVISFKKPQI